MEKVKLTTSDGLFIDANYFKVEQPVGWIILSHMMPATKESWDDLAKTFQDLKYECLAIDLRGHGESTGGPDGFKNFSDEDHQKTILDLEAAVKFLKEKGAISEKTIFIGASIGANLSLEYISKYPEFKKAVLLSLGIDYKGIRAIPLVEKLKVDQAVFFIGACDDERNLGNMANQIIEITKSVPLGVKKEIKIFDNGGHGTDILLNQPELKNLIIQFIQSND